jgi:hypothetical protein
MTDNSEDVPDKSLISCTGGIVVYSVQSFPLAVLAPTTVPRERVFSGGVVVRCFDHVAVAVTGLIPLEMVECLRATGRQRASVSVMRIEAIIHVAMETCRAVEPRSCSNKYAVNKPIWPVVPIRSAGIRRVVEISIGADRSRSDLYSNL